MTIESLNYILELYKTGSMTVAAENLFVSQSNLSQFFKNIEYQIDQPLFLRKDKKYIPTQIGLAYIQYAKDVLALTSALNKRISSISTDKSISVGSSSSLDTDALKKSIEKIEQLYPTVPISIIDCDNSDFVIFSLNNGSLDAACTTIPNEHFYNGPTIPLIKEELLLGVPTSLYNSKKLNRHSIDEQKFSAHDIVTLFGDCPFILQHSGSCIRYLTDAFFSSENFKPNVASHASTTIALRGMIQKGMGLGFIPKSNCEASPSIIYLKLKPPIYRIHAFMTNKSIQSSPTIRNLMQECKRRLQYTIKASKAEQ